jgi:ATP-dependent protease Clp ATPase subunit
MKCAEGCTCGTKKEGCKNKQVQSGTIEDPNTDKNAFERHQIAVEEAKLQITISLLVYYHYQYFRE